MKKIIGETGKDMVTTVCKKCNKKFDTFPAWLRRNRSKFCSKECYGVWMSDNMKGRNNPHWQGGKIKRICLWCGKEFKAVKAEVKKKWGRFCSKKCQNQWQRRKRVKKNCLLCNKTFEVKPSTIKAKQGKFCSQSCRTLWNNMRQRTQDTDIEIILESELKRKNIKYEKQIPIPIAYTIVDFLLPNKIIIYADGDYWHNLPKVKQRDTKQNCILNLRNYKVFRFTGKEIKKSAKDCVKKVLRYIKGGENI